MSEAPESNLSSAYGGPREDKSASLVLLFGLITTGLALLGVYVLDRTSDDFHIMGWYANYVLPVGAFIVGLVASSGYGVGSWFSGIKITRSLLWTVLLLQVLAYFAAQYIEFKGLHLVHRSDESPVGFFEYYDFAARSFAWQQKDGSAGEPLGMWGYAIRALELVGFVGGSLLVPALLRKAPYCQSCQRYMRTRQLAWFPGSVPARKVKKSDAAGMSAYQAENEKAFANGKNTWETLRQLGVAGKSAEFRNKLAELQPENKAAQKLPQRFSLKLVHCKRCHGGWLHAHLFSGQGREIKQIEVGRADVAPEFVRPVLT